MPCRKKAIFAISTIFIIVSMVLIATEFVLRFYISITRGELALIPDPELGWATKPNFKTERKILAFGGQEEYHVSITTNQYGFRRWGNVETDKQKIFIVGDSFTHSMYASNDKTWYSIFGEKSGFEVFTYGCSGYGTIQQYVVIKRYMDLINPNFIIIAFTSNDFENNIETGNPDPIESAFGRPYLNPAAESCSQKISNSPIQESLKISLKVSPIKRFLCSKSHLAYLLVTRSREFSGKFSSQNKNVDTTSNHQKSIYATETVLKNLRDFLKTRNAELIIFALSCEEGYLEDIKKISKNLDLRLISGVDEKIIEADSGKKLMRAADGSHLNQDGEKIVGEWLSEYWKSIP